MASQEEIEADRNKIAELQVKIYRSTVDQQEALYNILTGPTMLALMSELTEAAQTLSTTTRSRIASLNNARGAIATQTKLELDTIKKVLARSAEARAAESSTEDAGNGA